MFDPRAYNPPLNPSGNNIFHFTNIYIGRTLGAGDARLCMGAVANR